jgi:mRNA-degrading endonuclease toxin of MazEF toxin-antitoxin module
MDFNLDKMYCGAVRRGDVMIFEAGKKEKIMVALQDDVLSAALPTIVGAEVEPFKKGEEVFLNEVLLRGDETGLGKDGICMLHRLVTVDRRMIVAKKGELNRKRLKDILRALDITLGRFRDRE